MSFFNANQAKLSLKMLLSNYSWFNSIYVVPENYTYSIVVKIIQNNHVKKCRNHSYKEFLGIPNTYKGFSVNIES